GSSPNILACLNTIVTGASGRACSPQPATATSTATSSTVARMAYLDTPAPPTLQRRRHADPAADLHARDGEPRVSGLVLDRAPPDQGRRVRGHRRARGLRGRHPARHP